MPRWLNSLPGVALALLVCSECCAQAGFYWLSREAERDVEAWMLRDSLRDYPTVKPFATRDIKSFLASSAGAEEMYFSTAFFRRDTSTYVNLHALPLVYAEMGYSSSARGTYTAAGGTALGLSIGSNWMLYVDGLLGISRLPGYQQAALDSSGIIPTLGKPLQGVPSQDPLFLLPTARLSYKTQSIFQFDLGYGRHFLGAGYRSLFLSDVAHAYPYFKITTDVWHLKYVNLFSMLQGSRPMGSRLDRFERKYASTHYLSWAVSPRFNIGLFESVVWQARDTLSNRGFDPNYLNPIIFYRPVEYSVGSPDNALLGLDLYFKASARSALYAQLVLDEFLLSALRERSGWWANKYGLQVGMKGFDLPLSGLDWQVEFNLVRPFTYTHGSVLQNFAHHGQPLAHPLGTNFIEGLTALRYRYKRYFAEYQLMLAKAGRDSSGANLGGDLFRSYVNPARQYGNTLAQGTGQVIQNHHLTLGYLLYPPWQLSLAVSYFYRAQRATAGLTQHEQYLGVQLSSRIFNRNTLF